MTHPLQQQMSALGRLAKFLAVIYSLGSVLCLVAVAWLLLTLADYGLYLLFRVDDQSMRLLFAVTLMVATAMAIYRWLVPAVTTNCSDVQIAQFVERWSPRLQDQLSSSIAFLHQSADDQRRGSAALRRAVIDEAEALLRGVSLRQSLRSGPAIRSLLLAAVLCGSVLAAVVAVPPARLAARRLMLPLSEAPWPKRNQLRFLVAPRRLAAGDDFEVTLIDTRNQMPATVEFQYRVADDQSVQSRSMLPRGDKMVFRLENVTTSLDYRATGGDDDSMAWRRLDVVEPPRLNQLHVHLVPPAYTAADPTKSGNHIRALQGTTVTISGESSQPLQQVQLVFAAADQSLHRVGEIDADQVSFTVPAAGANSWTIQQSGRYWLKLTDQQGLVSGRKQRWQVTAIPDEPPVVSLVSPGQTTYVTSQAVIPLEAVVEDDLAIRSIELRYRRSNDPDDAEQEIELFEGPETARVAEQQASEPTTRQDIAYLWDLARLTDLHPQQHIDLLVAASDYLPQYNQSTVRRISVVTVQQFEDRIGQRQSHILEQLAAALEAQRDSRVQTTALDRQLAETSALDKPYLDLLQSAEFSQREVDRLLSNPEDGVQAQIESVLRDLDNNRLEIPELQQPLTRVLEQVGDLHADQLPAVGLELLAALKAARTHIHSRSGSDPDATALVVQGLRQRMATAGQQQTQIIDTLDQLLGELSQWDDFRRLSRDVRSLGDQQSRITAATEDVSRELIGRNLSQLNAEERTRLRLLAERQLELSRQFDAARHRMVEAQDRLRSQDPIVAETIGDALDAARNLRIETNMRDSGRQIQRNQLGQAAESQRHVARGLHELDGILTGRRESQLDSQLDQLAQAAEELADVTGEVEQLRDEWAQDLSTPAPPTDAVGSPPELVERIGRLARQLERLRADAAATVEKGEQSMQRAAESAATGRGEAAVNEATSTERTLQTAQRQLRNQIRARKQELMFRQLLRFRQQVEQLATRQQVLRDKTHQLRPGQPSATPSANAPELYLQQQALAEETQSLSKVDSVRPAFALALTGAARLMRQAARQLEQSGPGDPATASQREALARLRSLLAALKPSANLDSSSASGPAEQPEDTEPEESQVMLAELKLLRALQQRINQRTEVLEAAGSNAHAMERAAWQRELQELADEQGQLAGLILSFVQPSSPKPAETQQDPPTQSGPPDGLNELDQLLEGTPPAAGER